MSTPAVTPATCPSCGAPRPAAAEACPRCLLQLGLHPVPRDPEPSSPETRPAPAERATPSPEELAAAFPGLEIEEEIGRGGMGVVYRARQRKLDRFVALKILAPELSGDPAFAERFLREARALARLAHEHIVAVHDFGETDGLCWILMEHVDGVDLRRAMETGRLTPEQALAIVPQICDALACAHELGIVHRDIKPENVLLDRDGRAKIADFGLAKLVDPGGVHGSLTAVAQAMGTPHYMAPEQMKGARDVDHRADIFSLGVVLYEMLTGQLPVGRFDPPSKRVRVDVRLDEIVLHALETEPERRYQSVTEVKTDVERVSSTPPSASTSRPGAAASPPRWRWHSRKLQIAALILIVMSSSVADAAWGWRWIGLVLCGLLALVVGWLAFLGVQRSDPALRPREGLSRWRRIDLMTGAPLTAALGIALLFLGVAAVWERSTPHYATPRPRSTETRAWNETAARQTLRLFQQTGGGELPELAEPNVLSNSYELKLLATSPWTYLSAGFGLLLVSAGLLGFLSRFSSPARTVQACLAPAVAVTVAVLLGGLRHEVSLGGLRVRALQGLGGTATVDAGPEQVAEALAAILAERGYEVTGRLTEEWVERRTLDPLVRRVELQVQPRSPFDRWELTRRGPERLRPTLRLVVLGRLGRSDSGLLWDAGLVRTGAEEHDQWRRDVAALLDEVHGRLAADVGSGG